MNFGLIFYYFTWAASKCILCFFRGASAAARPPSSLRGGTASRLTTTMTTAGGAPPTANSHRIGTAIGYAGNVRELFLSDVQVPILQRYLFGLYSIIIIPTHVVFRLV